LVRIRLRRVGAKGQPSYRVVVADSRSPRDGRFIEIIGHYNPRVEPSEIVIDKEKALAWIAKGAKPSDSVVSLLTRAGIVERPAAAAAPVEAAVPVEATDKK
jgi:small subunit ribosomal protein S16